MLAPPRSWAARTTRVVARLPANLRVASQGQRFCDRILRALRLITGECAVRGAEREPERPALPAGWEAAASILVVEVGALQQRLTSAVDGVQSIPCAPVFGHRHREILDDRRESWR